MINQLNQNKSFQTRPFSYKYKMAHNNIYICVVSNMLYFLYMIV